jgi:Flp pilus assembly pilin Flp
MRTHLLNKKGQNTLEYVLMLGFVATIIVLFFTLFKGQFQSMVQAVSGKIQGAIEKMQ